MMNNSRDLWFATTANQEFIKGLPNLKRIENKKIAFKSDIKNIVPMSLVEAPSAGINIKIGITAISWKSKIPIANRPCLEFKSTRSIKIFETIAVDDIVNALPITNAEVKCNPNHQARLIEANKVINTFATEVYEDSNTFLQTKEDVEPSPTKRRTPARKKK